MMHSRSEGPVVMKVDTKTGAATGKTENVVMAMAGTVAVMAHKIRLR